MFSLFANLEFFFFYVVSYYYFFMNQKTPKTVAILCFLAFFIFNFGWRKIKKLLKRNKSEIFLKKELRNKIKMCFIFVCYFGLGYGLLHKIRILEEYKKNTWQHLYQRRVLVLHFIFSIIPITMTYIITIYMYFSTI